MINRIKEFLMGPADDVAQVKSSGVSDSEEKLRVAAVSLMIEAAVMDGEFDAAERHVISTLLAETFDMQTDEIEALVAIGEDAAEKSIELFGMTRVLKSGFDPEQRVALVEMLWRVVYADGELHDYEANLVSRICGLLHVSGRDSGDARKRVLEQLDNR